MEERRDGKEKETKRGTEREKGEKEESVGNVTPFWFPERSTRVMDSSRHQTPSFERKERLDGLEPCTQVAPLRAAAT